MSSTDIIFHTTPQGDVRVQIFVEQEAFWLTLRPGRDDNRGKV